MKQRQLKLRKAHQPPRALQTVIDGELEIVTPLHVGSGEELCVSDYTIGYGTFLRLDTEKLLARVADDPKALAAFDQPRLDVDDFLDRFGIRHDEVSRYSMKMATRRMPRPGDRVLEFARAGLGRQAYVPGSSLKGALVSGMLWMINAESRDGDNPLWVSKRFHDLLAECRKGRFPTDNALLETLLGRESHNRLGRGLMLADLPVPPDGLRLFHAGLFHLATPGGDHEWTAPRGKTHDSRRAVPVFLEAVAPGTTIPVQIAFDEFLQREARRKRSPIGFPDEALEQEWLSPNYILSGAMDLSYNTLYQEQQFFERAREPRLADATAALFERCGSLAENEVMLRLGWGLNWHGVTGYLWDDQTAKKLHLPQRTHNAFPYPKSRRVVFENETPIGTPGWVILRIHGTRTLPEEAAAPQA